MKLALASRIALGSGVASLSLVLCSGFGADQVQLEPRSRPSDEGVTPHSLRSVEDWARIASATNETHACLRRKATPLRELGGEELQALTNSSLSECFAPRGSSEQKEQVDGLPFTYAIHRDTHLPIEFAYACGCVVPRTCSVFARFAQVRQDECCRRGGVPLTFSGIGPIYGGCVPLELASPELREQQCDPNDPTLPVKSRFATAIRARDD